MLTDFHGLAVALVCSTCLLTNSPATAQSIQTPKGQAASVSGANVIVVPKFGGQIFGYAVDPTGPEGMLSESVSLPNGNFLAATETFDQSTGQIVHVIAKTETQDDFVTQGIFGQVGLVLYQHRGQNFFPTMKPFEGNKLNGLWKPPIMPQYQLWTMSANQGTSEIAAYQSSFETGLTYVFSSNIANNTFGPQISLQSIINVDEFFHPQIALDSKTNQAVLADSQDCPEPDCVMSVALVNLTTGEINEFTDNLGVGTVNGLAVDPETGIACTTTAIDQGIEFYDLAAQTGFEVPVPNSNVVGFPLDVESDPVHRLFLVSQFSSNGNLNDPQPRVYVYDEAGKLQETVVVPQRIPISPVRLALNPASRTGFVLAVVEPVNEGLELQSFAY